MNGPDHYRESERLLSPTASNPFGNPPGAQEPREPAVHELAKAQVHATLALAAATVETAASRGPGDCRLDWLEVIQ